MISIDNNRLKHMIGVANYMSEHATDYNVLSETAYIVGLLHDIGYIYGVKDHEQKGAALLRSFGFNEHLCEIISYHGTNINDVPDTILKDNLALLLFEADMMIDVCEGTAGEVVGMDRRIEGNARRYGLGSKQHQGITQHAENLKKILPAGWEKRYEISKKKEGGNNFMIIKTKKGLKKGLAIPEAGQGSCQIKVLESEDMPIEGKLVGKKQKPHGSGYITENSYNMLIRRLPAKSTDGEIKKSENIYKVILYRVWGNSSSSIIRYVNPKEAKDLYDKALREDVCPAGYAELPYPTD